MATSTGPWDETDDSTSYDPPATRPPRRSTLRVSHLRQPYARPPSPPRHPSRAASSRPKMGGVVAEKVEDLAASLQATTEVLSTADRMLEHYRDINVEQDEEIAKLRAELEKSADILRRERISRRRRLPATPSSSQSEDEHGRPARKRGPVRFDQDVRSDVDQLRQAVRNLKSEQNRLTGELEREREDRTRLDGDSWGGRRDQRGPNGTSDVISRADLAERERLLNELRETEEASRRQAEVLVKGLDAERDVLRESQRLASERDRELETLRQQLQANQKSQQDEIENRLKEIQKESLLDEANDTKIRDEIRSVASELETERRALEESEREKRLLASRVEDLSGRLELSERERREVMAELDAATKRLDQSEGGKNALVNQAEQLRQQFSRAEAERNDMSRKLEEAHAKLEDNESVRKKLQNRLESLNRQMEEGQGDREQLVEQLETLRGQVAKSEREKDEIMQQVTRMTRTAAQRRQSFGPTSSGTTAQLRRSMGRTEGPGGDHVSEMRRNLDRFELERDLDRRHPAGESFYDGLAGRNLRGGEDMDRFDMLNNLELLHQDIDRKDEQQERLLSQMRDLLSKYEESEEQKKRYMNELETVNKKLKEASKDVRELEEQLEEKDNLLKDSDKKRTELRNKALQSIKEYRTKCKRLEREAEQGLSAHPQEPLKEMKEIKELRAKVAKLVSKLQEEAEQRQNYEERVLQARHQERATKEEAASLYAQLQQERDAHTNALRELEEQIQSLTANHEQALQDAAKKSNKQRGEIEDQIADMKIQLADEKSTIKALRKRQEKDREEMEKLNTELNVATEENNKLKTRYEQAKEESENLKEKIEVNQSRIAQLEDAVRRNQYALEKAAEEQQSGLQKVDDQLDRVIEQVCRDSDMPLPSMLANGSIRNNSQTWIADMIGKFRWLSEELKARLSTERRLKEQADWSHKRIRDVVQKADEDKEYFISELDKQSMLLDELAAQKKGLESKNKQNTDNIKTLQDRIAQLTAHLETSTRALHATAEALDDRQKVLEEFEGLRGEQRERDKLHDKYVRYKERVGSIRRELQGAKSMAEDYRQETLDASTLSTRLLESLDRISSPKAKQRRLHQFPDTPPTNLRPSTAKTNPVSEWSPTSDNTFSTVSEKFPDPSLMTSPLKTDRKRSHKLQEYRSKGPIASTDLDYKER